MMTILIFERLKLNGCLQKDISLDVYISEEIILKQRCMLYIMKFIENEKLIHCSL